MGMQSPQLPEPLYHSADMVRDLIDEHRAWPRYETVHGELLVTPAPRLVHQRVAQLLFRRLADYLDRVRVGEAFMSPADISWGLDDVLVQPDVFVIPIDQGRGPDPSWGAVTRLLLAFEVLSPNSVRADRFTKRRLYQERGVPLYWVVDVESNAVEVWAPATIFPHVERETLTWRPDGATEPFVLPLAALLAAP